MTYMDFGVRERPFGVKHIPSLIGVMLRKFNQLIKFPDLHWYQVHYNMKTSLRYKLINNDISCVCCYYMSECFPSSDGLQSQQVLFSLQFPLHQIMLSQIQANESIKNDYNGFSRWLGTLNL